MIAYTTQCDIDGLIALRCVRCAHVCVLPPACCWHSFQRTSWDCRLLSLLPGSAHSERSESGGWLGGSDQSAGMHACGKKSPAAGQVAWALSGEAHARSSRL